MQGISADRFTCVSPCRPPNQNKSKFGWLWRGLLGETSPVASKRMKKSSASLPDSQAPLSGASILVHHLLLILTYTQGPLPGGSIQGFRRHGPSPSILLSTSPFPHPPA